MLPTSVYGNKIVVGYEDAMRTITPETVVLIHSQLVIKFLNLKKNSKSQFFKVGFGILNNEYLF
jgi:hypothetical protein